MPLPLALKLLVFNAAFVTYRLGYGLTQFLQPESLLSNLQSCIGGDLLWLLGEGGATGFIWSYASSTGTEDATYGF